MQTNTATTRIAVIGAGLAGLSAAVTAARGGAKVTVYERSQRVGGQAVSHESAGFTFNRGPHALYPTSKRLLGELGISVEGGVPPLAGYAFADGRLVPMPEGPFSLLDGHLFSPDERHQVEGVFASIAASPPGSLDEVSLLSWLDAQDLRGRSRQFITSLARLATYVDAPEDISAAAAFGQMKEGGEGVIYPDGGWQTIVDGLRAAALDAGAEIMAGTPVRAIERGYREFHIAVADGARVDADRVIVAVPPRAMRRLLPQGLLAGVLPEPSAATRLAALDVGLSSLPNPSAGFVLALDQPLYLSTHSLAARLTPDGGAAVSVARYIRAEEESRPAQFLAELESLLDAVQPGWRKLEVARQYLPAITVANSFSSAKSGGFRGRPTVTSLRVPGLYVAGDWVGGEGLLSAASLSSGIAAARQALGDDEETVEPLNQSAIPTLADALR